MSLTELDDRLDQRFRLLTGGSRAALERQQTLRATIGWSYALLTAAEQLLLGRLSVFAGGFDLAAAEAVCGLSPIDAREVAGLLGSLADKSLVVTEPASRALRYRLLETIRLFAAERLADVSKETTTVAAAHCAHYLAVAEAAAPHLSGPDQRSWFDRLEADRDNLRRAAQYAAGEPERTLQVLRFAVALWRYWIWSDQTEEAAGPLVPVLRRPEAATDPALLAEVLAAAALLIADSDLATSLQLAQQADDIADTLGDDRLLVFTRAMLGLAYANGGEQERAGPLARESAERARKLGDDVLRPFALVVCAMAAGWAESGPLHIEAIACTQRSGDLRLKSNIHNSAGWCALMMGDIPAARAHLEVAIRAAEATGKSHPVPSVNLGWVCRAEHDPDGARAHFEEAVRIGRRTGARFVTAGAILGLACLTTDLGDWHRAAVLHGAAQAIQDQTGVAWDPGDARYRLASLDQLTAALDDEQFRSAHVRGMALSFDQAIHLALGKSVPP
jgi:tetratricopeptide (TPR) repeat protein